MKTLNLWKPYRRSNNLQEQIDRVFGDGVERRGDESSLTTWAPAVDISETDYELLVKADRPGVRPEELDIRVENNLLILRGERKFEKIDRSADAPNKSNASNYLRVERSHGSCSRSFSLANSVNSEASKADYADGVLTLNIPKREEAKPRQIKVNVDTPAMAQSAGAR